MYFTGPSIRRSNGRGLNRHPPRNYLTWYMLPDANAAVDAVYRSDWGRIVATLIRLVRDFDVAEEAAQEAFAVAVDQWRASGGPEFPRDWIIHTAPYTVPDMKDMPARLDAVLTVVYLVFNEGYLPTRGEALVRPDLCVEAIRLARLVRTLMAPQPPAEATALLALMLLHDSRRDARLD